VLLAVATAKSRPATERVLAHTGIAGYFDTVVTMTEMARPKPDPDCVEQILARHQVACHEALLVGDTVTDARTAYNAGVGFWAVSYGYGPEDLRIEGGYIRMVDDFADLRQVLANGGGLTEGMEQT
jgi:phosphoglycolate phosphatase-like HAD superfamily hydrolase